MGVNPRWNPRKLQTAQTEYMVYQQGLSILMIWQWFALGKWLLLRRPGVVTTMAIDAMSICSAQQQINVFFSQKWAQKLVWLSRHSPWTDSKRRINQNGERTIDVQQDSVITIIRWRRSILSGNWPKCRKTPKQYGLELIVVEWPMTTGRKRERNREVSEISRSLNQAKNLRYSIIALSLA